MEARQIIGAAVIAGGLLYLARRASAHELPEPEREGPVETLVEDQNGDLWLESETADGDVHQVPVCRPGEYERGGVPCLRQLPPRLPSRSPEEVAADDARAAEEAARRNRERVAGRIERLKADWGFSLEQAELYLYVEGLLLSRTPPERIVTFGQRGQSFLFAPAGRPVLPTLTGAWASAVEAGRRRFAALSPIHRAEAMRELVAIPHVGNGRSLIYERLGYPLGLPLAQRKVAANIFFLNWSPAASGRVYELAPPEPMVVTLGRWGL